MADENLRITPEQEAADDRLYESLLADLDAEDARSKERTPATPTISWYEHTDRNNPLSQVLILSGSSHPEFAAQVAAHLGFEQTGEEAANFSDDSVRVRIGANMRDRKTLFIASPHGKETGNHF